ncbi:MAG TPA: single-stranded DNA-binding protein [Mycobacteriales bacterium]|nr:single-stranded DNA-binding protein [Mycobacteriales bacterium]
MEPQLPLQGNLTGDPTQQVVANGLRVTKFRLACSGRRFDGRTNEWISTPPVYLNVNCWRQLGDNVMQSLRKGDSVVVMGRLTYREWDDGNGGRRHDYDVDANAVGPDLSRYVATLSRPLRELPDLGDAPATETAEVAA